MDKKGTFILTTVLLYAPKLSEVPAVLLLLTCSPNDFLLPDTTERGTSIGKKENEQKNPLKTGD